MSCSKVTISALFTALALAAGAAETVPRMLLLDGVVVGGDIVAVGERGTILRSADSGKTWHSTPSVTNAPLTAIAFAADENHGWAVGHDAIILVTMDGGHTWRKQWQGENLSDSFLDVLALDADRAIAVGAFGLCMATEDGGKSWARRQPIATDYHLNRLTRGPTGTLYLAGEHGTLLRSTDHGASWVALSSPYDGSFYGILPLEARTLLAYGLRGHLYRSTDDGDTWQQVPNDRRVLLNTAVKRRSGSIVVAGQARALFESRDDAQSVNAGPPALTTAIAELLETPDGSLLALGEAGATLLEAGRVIRNPRFQDPRPPVSAAP